MLLFSEFLVFLIASMLVTLAPGPDNLFVLSTGILHGRKAALLAAWGMCSGISIHTCAAATGIAGIIYAYPPTFHALMALGVAYLLRLAWIEQSRKTWSDPDHPAGIDSSIRSMYRRGFLMNVVNPKVGLFFLSFLPQFAGMESEGRVGRLFLLGSVFMVQAFFWFSVIAWFAGALGLWLKKHPASRLWLARGSVAVYLMLALRLAFSWI